MPNEIKTSQKEINLVNFSNTSKSIGDYFIRLVMQ